jgi:16S rRNA (guanine966-N2)-methyltransferase
MRIISGKFKGKRIPSYGKIDARPTTDFAKEGLFNVLNNHIDFEELSVLDLFAGTGSISLEFISRGSSPVVAVEMNPKHCSYIRQLTSELSIDNLIVQRADTFRFVASCKMKFDLIFADPPYQLTDIDKLPNLIFKHQLLKEDGWLVLEHSNKLNFEKHPFFMMHKHYGNVNFSFFILPKETEASL